MGRGGTYEANARAGIFLTDKAGVSEWSRRVEAHLFDSFDEPPDVAVIRVPRAEIAGRIVADPIQDVPGSTSYILDTESTIKGIAPTRESDLLGERCLFGWGAVRNTQRRRGPVHLPVEHG